MSSMMKPEARLEVGRKTDNFSHRRWADDYHSPPFACPTNKGVAVIVDSSAFSAEGASHRRL
jgi:hypothetical protein